MKRVILILIMSLISVLVIGQVRYKDLNGEWEVYNNDSAYYHSDTIRFIQDLKSQNNFSRIVWEIEKRKLTIYTITFINKGGYNLHKESVDKDFDKEAIILGRHDGGQTIKIKRNGRSIDFFRILNYTEKSENNWPNGKQKILTLKRLNL